MNIKTKHGKIETPNFFPIIGWPAGRGEYDRLFKSLEYFQKKLNHSHFLFNFSSFAFGFVIPVSEFNSIFASFKNKDLRDSLIEQTGISKNAAKSLIILLDIGGNRIFNKVVFDNKDISDIDSYKIYIDAYFEFIKSANVDIYVSFDIGPSYTTRDNVSKKGVKIWNDLSSDTKSKINQELLNESIKRKVKGTLLMVPISGANIDVFKEHLNDLFDKHKDSIDYLAIGGIANQGYEQTNEVLKTLRKFLNNKRWDVKVHGLGLGGWKNIPLLVKYDINTCDAATPWIRACADAISNMYIPLFDSELNIGEYDDAFSYYEIYDEVWNKIKCNCPFCKDIPIKKLQRIYKKADKHKNGKDKHGNEYYEMRVRVFYHNVFQHIALLKKLSFYKEKYGDNFLKKFSKELKNGKIKKYFDSLC